MRAFLFVGVCLVLASCFDSGDCLFTNTNVVKVNLKDLAAPGKSKEVTFTSIYIPNEGILLEQTTTSSVLLLVNPRLTETKFVFQQEQRSDTLVLGYRNQTVVLSTDCGSFNYQKDLEVKYSTFGDRVSIKNPQLLTSVQVNVEILY